MKTLLAVLCLLASSWANAATYYMSDCQAGADPACVAGSDVNPGTDPALPRLTTPAFVAGNINRYARGSSFTFASSISVYLPASTKAAPFTFEDYTPIWCTGGCLTQKPIFTFASNVTGFNFTEGGTADPDEGYVVRNIDIRGSGYTASGQGTGHGTGSGIFVFNDADWITVDGVLINGFNVGVYVSSNNGIGAGANGNNENFTLKNSTIQNNRAQGFLGGGAWMLIENNLFHENGFLGAIFYHNIYVDIKETNPVSKGVVIRGNTLANNAIVSGTCQAVALVAHANTPDMVIENNTITETATSGTCYGIDINSDSGGASVQDFSRLIIRGNKLVLAGSAAQGIGCSACPNALIENNLVIRLGGTGNFSGIVFPSTASQTGRGDPADGSVTVRNNSIYIDASSSASQGIYFSPSTTGESITNNVVLFSAASSASAICFRFGTRAIGTFAAMNYNACYRPSADALWSEQHSTLATAQAAGFDTNSFKTDPGLTTPAASDYLLQASSGAAAVINAGSTTRKARLGYRGKPANGARDIGACEYRTGDACSAATASVPSSATGLR